MKDLTCRQAKIIYGGDPGCWDNPDDDKNDWPFGGSTGPFNPIPPIIDGNG